MEDPPRPNPEHIRDLLRQLLLRKRRADEGVRWTIAASHEAIRTSQQAIRDAPES